MAEYDSSNPRHIALQRRAAQAMEKSASGFIDHIMGMGDGRAYIHGILVRCHVFSNPYTGHGGTTAFACGELNIGQQLLADIMRFCPDQYTLMMREANARDIASDVRRGRSDTDSDGRDSEPAAYVHPADWDSAGSGSPTTSNPDYNPVERDED